MLLVSLNFYRWRVEEQKLKLSSLFAAREPGALDRSLNNNEATYAVHLWRNYCEARTCSLFRAVIGMLHFVSRRYTDDHAICAPTSWRTARPYYSFRRHFLDVVWPE